MTFGFFEIMLNFGSETTRFQMLPVNNVWDLVLNYAFLAA